MPIEIRELIIKATLDDTQQAEDQERKYQSDDEALEHRIVALCVEKVLEILQEKSER